MRHLILHAFWAGTKTTKRDVFEMESTFVRSLGSTLTHILWVVKAQVQCHARVRSLMVLISILILLWSCILCLWCDTRCLITLICYGAVGNASYYTSLVTWWTLFLFQLHGKGRVACDGLGCLRMLTEIIKIALSNFLHVSDLLGLVLLNVVELLRVI